MTTTPGWEPGAGPTRGETARQTPRGGAGGWPAGDPRRQPAGRDGAPGRDSQNGQRGHRGNAGWDGRDGRSPAPSFTPVGRMPPAPSGYQRPGPQRGGRGPGRPDGLDDMRGSGALRWVGAWSVKVALLVLTAATVLGVIFTLADGKEPGFLIGLFIAIGVAIAALGVRRGGVYLFFPLPALFAFVAAVLTGEIHDRQLASSTAGTAAGFTQWLAGVFYPMCAATIVVLLVGAFRWLLARQLVSGQFAMSAGRPHRGSRPAPGSRRAPADDPWAEKDPSADGATRVLADRPQPDRPASGPAGQGRPPWLGPDRARSARTARDQRPDRDAWGDPWSAPDRNQPGAPSRPRPDNRGGRPAGPGGPAQPRAARPQQPRDPRDPRDLRPQRPQPRQPRDPWE